MKHAQKKISEIKPNPNNPRLIKDEKFKKLCQSLKDFPEMLELRPIVVNKDMIILGGNMRYKAAKEIGLKEIPVKVADNLTPEQEREFLIKDNTSGGEWDYDMLANEWEEKQLEAWGLDVPNFDNQDFSDKNKEIDTDFDGQKYSFKLEYSEDEYTELKEKISKTGKTPEQIFYEALI